MIIMMIFNISTNIIFSQNFISLFLGLFNDKTDLRGRYLYTIHGLGHCWWGGVGRGVVLKLFNPWSTTLGLQKKQHPKNWIDPYV
jgi:hypothetical protein